MYELLFSLLISVSQAAGNPVASLYAENRLEEAASVCRQFDMLGSNPKIDVLCAWIYLRTDRLESAHTIMSRLKGPGVKPDLELLEIYEMAKQKKFDLAQAGVDEFIKAYRNAAIGHDGEELSGELYEMRGRLEPAAFIYQILLRADPSRVRAHWGLGRYYYGTKDYRRAKSHLELVARSWPKHVGSRYYLALVAFAENNMNDASRWLAKCYSLDKADPQLLEQLGIYFEKKKQVKQALRYWRKALDIRPDSPIAKAKMAEYGKEAVEKLAQANDSDSTVRNIDTVVKKEKAGVSPKLLRKRATIYMKKNKFELAAADWIIYLKSNPKDSEALTELGKCFINMKQPDQAAEQFTKAISIDPQNGINYGWVAFLFESQGKLDDAKQAWLKARDLFLEPKEVAKANRRIASIENKIRERDRKERQRQKERDEEDFE